MARDGWVLIGGEDICPRDPPRRVHKEDVLVAGCLSAGRTMVSRASSSQNK